MKQLLKYQINNEHNTLFIKSYGALKTADVMQMNQEIHDSNSIPKKWFALIDLRDTTEFLIDTEGMKAIVKQDQELYDKYQFAKLAFVATHDVVFGMARMYQSLTIDNLVELQVHRDIDPALQWLGLDNLVMDDIYASRHSPEGAEYE
ncbi:MAG: hypothetical protein COA73_06790 [Candidatus Hydrogenedentota bacterium]|nr:MAG: hypothetical protein COA73_06790 [Candidatus Hydrogenedentota bacterium]